MVLLQRQTPLIARGFNDVYYMRICLTLLQKVAPSCNVLHRYKELDNDGGCDQLPDA